MRLVAISSSNKKLLLPLMPLPYKSTRKVLRFGSAVTEAIAKVLLESIETSYTVLYSCQSLVYIQSCVPLTSNLSCFLLSFLS